MQKNKEEKIVDLLGYEGLKIVQREDILNFSIDSTILANFVSINPKAKKIIDLGCGNGYIPIFLTLRTKAQIYGVEIQPEVVELAKKSVTINHLHPGWPRPCLSPCRRQGAWETSAATIKVRWRSCHAPTPQAGNTNGRTAYPAFARSKIVLSRPRLMKPATFSPSTQRGRSSVITRHISGHR